MPWSTSSESHLNSEVTSHGSNVRHWIGKAIREGKNRHSREEKISMTGHLEFPNPCPRGHGWSIKRRKHHTTKQKRTRRLEDEPRNNEQSMSHMQQKKGNCHFPAHLTPTPPCLECQHTWKPACMKYKGTDLRVIHGWAPIRLLGMRYNIRLHSTAQRR